MLILVGMAICVNMSKILKEVVPISLYKDMYHLTGRRKQIFRNHRKESSMLQFQVSQRQENVNRLLKCYEDNYDTSLLPKLHHNALTDFWEHKFYRNLEKRLKCGHQLTGLYEFRNRTQQFFPHCERLLYRKKPRPRPRIKPFREIAVDLLKLFSCLGLVYQPVNVYSKQM